MRELIFRGKKISNNTWVEGGFTLDAAGHPRITTVDSSGQGLVFHEVIPESVGQFIGIKGYTGEYEQRAQNEVRLFEGDVVEAMSQGCKGTFEIKLRLEGMPAYILFPAYFGGEFWKIHGSDIGRKAGDYYDDLKVIGKVFDNPELVK